MTLQKKNALKEKSRPSLGREARRAAVGISRALGLGGEKFTVHAESHARGVLCRHRWFIVFVLLGLTACAKPRVPLVQTQDLVDWQTGVRIDRAQLNTLRAEAEVYVRRRGKGFRIQVSMLVGKPDRLFAESHGFGLAQSYLSLAQDRVKLWLPTEREGYTGSGRAGLKKILGLDLDPGLLVALLLGRYPNFSEPPSRGWQQGEIVTLVWGEGKNASSLEIEKKTQWLRKASGPQALKFEFSRPLQLPQGKYPSWIRVRSSSGKVDIHFKKVEPNPGVPEKYFGLNLPRGVKVRSIEDL